MKNKSSRKLKTCPECDGQRKIKEGGTLSPSFKCDVCNGKGIISKSNMKKKTTSDKIEKKIEEVYDPIKSINLVFDGISRTLVDAENKVVELINRGKRSRPEVDDVAYLAELICNPPEDWSIFMLRLPVIAKVDLVKALCWRASRASVTENKAFGGMLRASIPSKIRHSLIKLLLD